MWQLTDKGKEELRVCESYLMDHILDDIKDSGLEEDLLEGHSRVAQILNSVERGCEFREGSWIQGWLYNKGFIEWY